MEEQCMMSDVPKEVDKHRLTADLASAAIELLSAQCASDRIRLQYSPQDIAKFAEARTLKRAIASAEAVHRFFSQIAAQIKLKDGGSDGNK
jgi:hypothetical protein